MIDYRVPERRRETFLKFYEFHLKYKSHPGGVYYLFPWFVKKFDFDEEDKYWFAYINGNTQNPITTWLIYKNFPSPGDFMNNHGDTWFNDNWDRLQWDVDRRYQKKSFPSNVKWYWQSTLDKKQWDFFSALTGNFEDGPYKSFHYLWDGVRSFFPTFGRLSAFSYLEYLYIMGMPQDCSDLFLEDIQGSQSHRNGLCILLGRDDLDWHKNDVKYSKLDIKWLVDQGYLLLKEAQDKIENTDISYYNLESTLCTYKSWHRRNRRYPNVYNDMMYERIKWAEQRWPKDDLSLFWEARADSLPEHLLLECNPNDPGLCPEKQNYYLDHGIPVMMSKDFPEFDNPFDRKAWS